MKSAYQPDLAYIHDAGFTNFVAQSVPGLLTILRGNRITRGLVVDLGCGSGVWARELIRAGYQVMGVDLSEAMLRIARKRAPKARFVRASLFDFPLPPCIAVTAIGECLNYRFNEKINPQRLLKLFRHVYAALAPGGVFVFDVASPGRVPKPTERYFEGRDWAILVRNEEDRKQSRLTRRMTIFRKLGRLYRRTHEVHRQYLYPRNQIVHELRESGLKVQVVNSYGGEPFAPSLNGFIARKPARR